MNSLSFTASPTFTTPKIVIPPMAERSKALNDESERVLGLAAEAFGGDGGWNSSIIDVKIDLLEEEDGCIHRCEVTAVVRVQLVSHREKFHEDIGCGVSENTFKPYAIEDAKKEAITDARTRALKLLLKDKGLKKPTHDDKGIPLGNSNDKRPAPQAEAKPADLFVPPPPSGIPHLGISVVSTSSDSSAASGSGDNDNVTVDESKACSRSENNNKDDDNDDDDEGIFLANVSDEMLLDPLANPVDTIELPNEKKQKMDWQQQQQPQQPIQINQVHVVRNMQNNQNQGIQSMQNIQNMQKHADAPTQPPKRPPFRPVVVANLPKRQK